MFFFLFLSCANPTSKREAGTDNGGTVVVSLLSVRFSLLLLFLSHRQQQQQQYTHTRHVFNRSTLGACSNVSIFNSMFARLGTDYEIRNQWFFAILETITTD